MKLPYPCPNCGKPIMNYSGNCSCGRGMRRVTVDVVDENGNVVHAGKVWGQEEWCVAMGFDAFRIAQGKKPKNFTVAEVKAWLEAMIETCNLVPDKALT